MKSCIGFGALAVGLALVWGGQALAQGAAAAGQVAYNQKCATCHTLARDPAHGLQGPNLMGVIGRTAGTVTDWDFSPALRESKIVWTEENLNKWLTDPEALVPGSKMPVKMPNRFEREDVIAYIRSVIATEGAKK
jgi:cytochrome c